MIRIEFKINSVGMSKVTHELQPGVDELLSLLSSESEGRISIRNLSIDDVNIDVPSLMKSLKFK